MMERELKLTASDQNTLDAILNSDLVKSVCISDPGAGAVSFNAIYYDTEDQQLQSLHCGLRARQEGEVLKAAMKLPGQIVDGLSERVEYEADLADWPRSFDDFPRGELRNALSDRIWLDAPMIERVRVSMARRIRILQVEGTKIELVADHGIITGLKGEHHLDEIELELKQGNVAPMIQLGKALKDRYELSFSERTKLGIGLSLC